MQSWGSFSYLFGPLVAAIGIGVLVVVLRWSHGTKSTSLVAKPVRPSEETDYGLLVPIASPPSYVEGEILRRTLEDNGLRANLAMTTNGPRVMVFPQDEEKARAVLKRGPGAPRV
jgi:hypothetical protein